ncbi:tyrosine-type recombinase/integrase [Desulforhopalus sp. 52FAK]
MTNITTRNLNSAQAKPSPYFIRDSRLKGFAVKVYPSGTIKFIAEIWQDGKSIRKTLGDYPIMSLPDARQSAISFINEVRQGKLISQKKQQTLGKLLAQYLSTTKLKPNTIKNYKHVVLFYLSDWLNKPITQISKRKVEAKFYQIRDIGVGGGKPTFSQAIATMRYLSALMNYAMADEIIDSNPVQVLKLKRVDRSLRKRENYLPANKAKELLHISASETHPVTLAVHLMLYTGLRKNEALKLMWCDIEAIEGIDCLIIRDTKNNRPHYVPITSNIRKILAKAANNTEFIFPSTQKKGAPMEDVRPTLGRLSKMIDMDFRCHDLRRTFATRASDVGIDYLMIKRMLNHKSNDITGHYIQWHSKDNLESMRVALKRIKY